MRASVCVRERERVCVSERGHPATWERLLTASQDGERGWVRDGGGGGEGRAGGVGGETKGEGG